MFAEAWYRIDQNPTCVYDTDPGTGRTALHELCRLTSSASRHVRTDYSPEFSDDEDYPGTDQGLIAMENDHQDTIDLARLIIETSHILLQKPDSVTRYIIYSFEQSILLSKDSNGNIPLHTLCEGRRADIDMMTLMFSLCVENSLPDMLNIPTVIDLISHKNYRQCTPLHHISQCVCSFSALKLMLDSCPTAGELLHVRDEDGDTPLHWAFAAGVSTRRLELYLLKSKELLYLKNKENETPLCALAIDDFDSARAMWQRVALIMDLILGRREAVQPMFALAELSNLMPLYLVELGLRFFREELEDADEHGRFPLHVAAMCPSRELGDANFLTLLDHFPAAVTQRCRQGRLPLHYALETGKSLDCIQVMMTAHPDGLHEVDPVSRFPCFLLAGLLAPSDIRSMPDHRLTVCYYLLREDPSVLQGLCHPQAKSQV
jgi:ankyrin repeat protein